MLVVVYASERVSPSVRSVKTEVVGTGFMVSLSPKSNLLQCCGSYPGEHISQHQTAKPLVRLVRRVRLVAVHLLTPYHHRRRSSLWPCTACMAATIVGAHCARALSARLFYWHHPYQYQPGGRRQQRRGCVFLRAWDDSVAFHQLPSSGTLEARGTAESRLPHDR